MIEIHRGVHHQHKHSMRFLSPHRIDGEENHMTLSNGNINNGGSFRELTAARQVLR